MDEENRALTARNHSVAGHSAGVVHIADGQAGQVTGDAHLAHLPDGQGEGIGAVGLAGKTGIAVRVDAGVGHGFLIGSFLPEFNAHVQGSSSAGTKGEHAQQQYRKQGGAYALTGLSHGYLPFFAAKAALSGTQSTGTFNAKIACARKNVNLLREPFTKTLHIRNKKTDAFDLLAPMPQAAGLLPGKHRAAAFLAAGAGETLNRQANSFADWLRAALLVHPFGGPLRRLAGDLELPFVFTESEITVSVQEAQPEPEASGHRHPCRSGYLP